MTEAAEIAKGLTEAQRRWLLSARRVWQDPELWYTYPPRNTCDVLRRLGLWQPDGSVTAFGLAVRALLQQEPRHDR